MTNSEPVPQLGDPGHEQAVRDQFRVQAATFDSTGFAARGLEWILEAIAPQGHEAVLDVACGAAHLGRALAPQTRYVHGLDLVPEMLAQGQRLAKADGLRNLALQRGNAYDLPWLDAQFDLVVCRLALHQVDSPLQMVKEMVRVTSPGGRIALVDMIAEQDPEIAAETNRLERLRDPSHARTLPISEIITLAERAGALVTAQLTQNQALDLEDWMERTQTPVEVRRQIRERLLDELNGGSPTGLRPSRSASGVMSFVHPWAVVIAERP